MKDGSVWGMGERWSNTPKMLFPKGVVDADVGHAVSVVEQDGSLKTLGYYYLERDIWVPVKGRRRGKQSVPNPEKPDLTKPHLLVDSGVLAVDSSGPHTLFLKDDGTLWGFGSGNHGELGPGQYSTVQPIQIEVPMKVQPISNTHNYFFTLEGDTIKLARPIKHLQRSEFNLHVLATTGTGRQVEKRFSLKVSDN